ncbi:TPA: 50S ribosomal protein L20 [Candidatus Berkelbacteria bacterium]|uniref:Large ribosomal subunit protein bL20 n=1 Tax=Berkelbacteria bacterium GW2011_GWE1_39_12 TaxID=1618337 RepID=A0A0G4B5B2_9BACT|nr:MAG: ribosomal protein L20, bacterial-type, large subunit ribosomal protein L20 [Berkelbacteria bacterium GW2011_GWE1_39_12]HBO60309.1 50S ribosomal protein L20 [Candidatus Berkelbacteria bacterium]
MARVKRGVMIKKSTKNTLAKTKGFRHGRKNLIRMAKQAIVNAGKFAYRDRRNRKRSFRQLWIIQINAACGLNDIKYSIFMKGLKDKNIELDRKVLADIAENNPEEFAKIVEKVKTA